MRDLSVVEEADGTLPDQTWSVGGGFAETRSGSYQAQSSAREPELTRRSEDHRATYLTAVVPFVISSRGSGTL